MSRGKASWWDDRCSVGDEGSSSGELGVMGREGGGGARSSIVI